MIGEIKESFSNKTQSGILMLGGLW
jgi:hypothetical protein